MFLDMGVGAVIFCEGFEESLFDVGFGPFELGLVGTGFRDEVD